jgi:hypothetical protein
MTRGLTVGTKVVVLDGLASTKTGLEGQKTRYYITTI